MSLIPGLIGVHKQNPYYAQVQQTTSQNAQFLNNLQVLQQTDPVKFKATMLDISDQLQSAANTATGQRAQTLSSLAAKFKNAAQTGDLSQLKQPGVNLQGIISLNKHADGPNAAHKKTNNHSLFGNIFKSISQTAKS